MLVTLHRRSCCSSCYHISNQLCTLLLAHRLREVLQVLMRMQQPLDKPLVKQGVQAILLIMLLKARYDNPCVNTTDTQAYPVTHCRKQYKHAVVVSCAQHSYICCVYACAHARLLLHSSSLHVAAASAQFTYIL
jgi:hypothetical protein